MTSIAWKDGILAADGRQTEGSLIVTDKIVKIVSIRGAFYKDDPLLYLAAAGNASDEDKVIEALFSRNTDVKHDTSCIVIGTFKNYFLESGTGYLLEHPRNEPMAVGSGTPYLIAAMRLGKSAKEAVKFAITMDCYSGGKITTVRTPKHD